MCVCVCVCVRACVRACMRVCTDNTCSESNQSLSWSFSLASAAWLGAGLSMLIFSHIH